MQSHNYSPRPGGPVLVLAAAIAFLEGYDLACYGVTVPVLLTDPALALGTAGAAIAGALVPVGMLVGAALMGTTVGRVGPRRLLLCGSATFSTGMMLCALAPSLGLFAAARLIIGLGLGVALPALIAYLADMSGPARRGRTIGTVMAGLAVGALAAPLVAALLLPEASWRWIYLLGAVPALLLLPVGARLLPDSRLTPRPSDRPSRVATGHRTPLGLRPLLAAEIRRVTVHFWVMTFCGLLLVFGISTWLPTIMQRSGYPLGSVLLQATLLWTGAGVGLVAGGKLIDVVGAKPVVASAFATGSLCLLAMSLRPSAAALCVLMFVSGVGLVGGQVLVNAFMATRYPEDLRGPGIGWALSAGRLGAILGPALGGLVLAAELDLRWNFTLFAVPGVVGAVAAALVPTKAGPGAEVPTDRSFKAWARGRARRRSPRWS